MALTLDVTNRYSLIPSKRSFRKKLADESCKVLQCCVSTLVSLCRHRLFCLSYQLSASKSVVQLGPVQYYILRVAHILYVLLRVKPILYHQGIFSNRKTKEAGKIKDRRGRRMSCSSDDCSLSYLPARLPSNTCQSTFWALEVKFHENTLGGIEKQDFVFSSRGLTISSSIWQGFAGGSQAAQHEAPLLLSPPPPPHHHHRLFDRQPCLCRI